MATTVTDVPLAELYRTQTLLEAIQQYPRAPQFLRDKLFSVIETSPTDQVMIDFFRGAQKLAPFCSRYKPGISIPRERIKTSVFSPPFVKPVRPLSADDLFYRTPGASIGGGNATSRDADLLVMDQQDLDARISRTEEWMVAQCLFSGKIQCLDGDDGKLVAEIDYWPLNLTVLEKPWSDPTSNPLSDLKNCMRIVASRSGYAANLIVMGKDAADAFETNPNVTEAYNKLNIQPGLLDPKVLQDLSNFGITALGTYRQLPLFVDEAQYEDASGAFQFYVPPGAVLVAATALQSRIAYAAVAQIDEDEKAMLPYEGTRIPQIWYEKGEETRMFRLAARPIPVPADTTSWTVLQAIQNQGAKRK